MSTYWQNFNLEFDPFAADQRMTCFISPQWRQLLDLLTHLCVSSQAILLVTGLSGIGKTTLLRQFIEEVGDKAGICKIQGDPSIGPDVLYYLLAKHLGLATSDGQKENFKRQLMTQLEGMKQNSQHYLLVVDDAHLLPERTLAAVLEITALQSQESNPLHVLLFGGPQLEATIGNITAQNVAEGATHTSRIKPLNREMTEQYVAHRLQVVGYAGEALFSKGELDQLYHSSSGIPAKINYFAKQLLEMKLPSSSTSRISNDNPIYSRKPLIAVAAVLGVLVVAYLGYSELNKLPTNEALPKELSAPVTREVLDNSQPPAKIQVAGLDENEEVPRGEYEENSLNQEANNSSLEELESSQGAQLSANQSETDEIPQLPGTQEMLEQGNLQRPVAIEQHALAEEEKSVIAPPNVTNLEPEEEQAPVIKVESASEPAVNSAKTSAKSNDLASMENRMINGQGKKASTTTATANKKPAPVTTQTVVVEKNMSKPGARSYSVAERRLLKVNKKYYTIQLMGSYSQQPLVQFAKKSGIESRVSYFKTQHQGKEWHVMIYGEYPTIDKARLAIKTLPAQVQKQKPWPRSYESVQESIKTVA